MWVLWVDLGAGLIGLATLGWTGLHLWRQVRSLGRTVSAASGTIGELTSQLESLAAPSRSDMR